MLALSTVSGMTYDPYTRPPSMRPVDHVEDAEKPRDPRTWSRLAGEVLCLTVLLALILTITDDPHGGWTVAAIAVVLLSRAGWFAWDYRRFKRGDR